MPSTATTSTLVKTNKIMRFIMSFKCSSNQRGNEFNVNVKEHRHCERSEAIHDPGLHGLPRRCAPRNDGFLFGSNLCGFWDHPPWQGFTGAQWLQQGLAKGK